MVLGWLCLEATPLAEHVQRERMDSRYHHLSTAIDEFDGANPGDSHHYLFIRSGQPVALHVWVVSRAWLVSICSGVTLLIGFFTIFSKIRFRTIWLGTAAIGLLAAILFQGSVMFLALQYAFIGMGHHSLGTGDRALAGAVEIAVDFDSGFGVGRNPAIVESSLNQAPSVGSDDSTAIRVAHHRQPRWITSPIRPPYPNRSRTRREAQAWNAPSGQAARLNAGRMSSTPEAACSLSLSVRQSGISRPGL